MHVMRERVAHVQGLVRRDPQQVQCVQKDAGIRLEDSDLPRRDDHIEVLLEPTVA
ncbi:hypothetical protein DEMA109039_00290 [Deinococcus marmoris]